MICEQQTESCRGSSGRGRLLEAGKDYCQTPRKSLYQAHLQLAFSNISQAKMISETRKTSQDMGGRPQHQRQQRLHERHDLAYYSGRQLDMGCYGKRFHQNQTNNQHDPHPLRQTNQQHANKQRTRLKPTTKTKMIPKTKTIPHQSNHIKHSGQKNSNQDFSRHAHLEFNAAPYQHRCKCIFLQAARSERNKLFNSYFASNEFFFADPGRTTAEALWPLRQASALCTGS